MYIPSMYSVAACILHGVVQWRVHEKAFGHIFCDIFGQQHVTASWSTFRYRLERITDPAILSRHMHIYMYIGL